jgi:hypothetical protein
MIIPPLDNFFERRFRILKSKRGSAVAHYADGVLVPDNLRLFGFAAKAGLELGVVLFESHRKSRTKTTSIFILPI